MSHDNVNGDLISRSALLKKVVRKYEEYDEGGWSMTIEAVPVEAIEAAPAVDAVPVVHGRWIEVRNKHSEKVGEKCCPNCGAKMDGDGHE